MQALLENKRNDLVEKLLAPCRQQPASDQMVLFVRAITAAACLQSHSLSLEVFSSSLRADGLQCEYVSVWQCLPMLCVFVSRRVTVGLVCCQCKGLAVLRSLAAAFVRLHNLQPQCFLSGLD